MYIFLSKSKLIDKIKDLELKNEILKKMLEIKEQELKNKNSTYQWR